VPHTRGVACVLPLCRGGVEQRGVGSEDVQAPALSAGAGQHAAGEELLGPLWQACLPQPPNAAQALPQPGRGACTCAVAPALLGAASPACGALCTRTLLGCRRCIVCAIMACLPAC